MNNSKNALQEISVMDVPEKGTLNTIYHLVPNRSDKTFYAERTDRNIGWITHEEQEILRNSTVGIAGTGGMGGLLAATLVRAGVGEVRISDGDLFDVSNINRQFGASRITIGKSKVFETARQIRNISDDTTLVIYPQGVTESTVSHFVDGCSIICDEIELLAMDSRILLHQESRSKGVSLFNCNTTGFSTNLFLYTPSGMTMEEATGFTYEEAKEITLLAKHGNPVAINTIVRAMIHAVVPNLPEYRAQEQETDRDWFFRRLLEEQKVPIIATNPPMATGFLANRVLLYLLRNSGIRRNITVTPEMPGYMHFDAAHMTTTSSTEGWF